MTSPDQSGLAEVYRHVRELLQRGAPWDACDSYREQIALHPGDAMLHYLGALAHARAGAANQAHALLELAHTRAQAEAANSPELLADILSLRGRLWKDRLHHARDGSGAMDFASRARADYLAAYQLQRHTFAGINAASLSLMMGEAEQAKSLAAGIAARLAAKTGARSVWDYTTEGEALLLLGEQEAARRAYAEAARLAAADSGSIATMRRQLKLLARVLPGVADMLDVLRAPTVLACAGNMIDAPGRAKPRFPAALEPAVAAAIRAHLKQLHRPVIFSSAACGADLLLIEAALELGAEVNIVLPFNREDFVRTSVAAGGEKWVRRFNDALLRATRLIPATQESHLGDDVLFEHAALMLEGLAALRARQLETEPGMLCVMDLDAAGLVGGTRDSFERWTRRFGAPQVIDLKRLRIEAGLETQGAELSHVAPVAAAPAQPKSIERPRRMLKTLLFADVAGYSRLQDAHIPVFQERFWQVVRDNLAALQVEPRLANSWGDAIYLVLDTPDAGAEFALRLVEGMQKANWSEAGLQANSQIRIALHSGAVFCGFDPIIGRDNYFGSNVTRAARIEPVTAQGMVYVSEDFAATLAATGREDFALEYIGEMALAKAYGNSRIYRLDWR